MVIEIVEDPPAGGYRITVNGRDTGDAVGDPRRRPAAMTRNEARVRVETLAEEHFRHRGDASPRIRRGFVMRETARLLGEPIPHGVDNPRSAPVGHRLAAQPSLEALLEASLKEVHR
jgi:hypothetical protein